MTKRKQKLSEQEKALQKQALKEFFTLEDEGERKWCPLNEKFEPIKDSR